MMSDVSCENNDFVVVGVIQSEVSFDCKIKTDVMLSGIVSVQVDHSVYTGDLNVIPKVDSETVLETDNKVLNGNVTVEKIPYYEVSNKYGGNTVIIGGK